MENICCKPSYTFIFSNFVEWKVFDLKNEGENEEVSYQISKFTAELLEVH